MEASLQPRGRHEGAAFPEAEYHKACLILMHTPGEELFNGILHPAAALFEDCMDMDSAIAEHENYIAVLKREAGAEVITVRDVLKGTPHDELVDFASRFLTYDKTELSHDDRCGVDEYKLEVLRKMSQADLVRVILNRPVVHLRKMDRNTGWKARIVHKPLVNMFFMRDQMIVTPCGPVVSKMYSPQRNREADIVEFCLRRLGMNPVHRLCGNGSFMEGGDYIPFGKFAFVGRGLRTTQEAVNELMSAGVMGHDKVVVVKDSLCSQEQMHLDTYFNVADEDLAVMDEDRMKAAKGSRLFLRADLYERGGGGYERVGANVPFMSFLASCGVKVIAVKSADRKRYGTNFLCVGRRRIMAVDGQPDYLRKALDDCGVRADYVRLDNLIKGYGAAHCMTQVLLRQKE